MQKLRLFTVTTAIGIVFAAIFIFTGINPDTASAYSPSQHRAIHFITHGASTTAHIIDTTSAACDAGGNGNRARSVTLIRHAVRDFIKLRNAWIRLPAAGGAAWRVEHLFHRLLERDVRVYVLCVANIAAGDTTYSNLTRGLRAYDRSLSDLSKVCVELRRLR